MIYPVKWMRSFCALKSFKIFHFSEEFVWSTYFDIFSQVVLKSGVWKTVSFLISSCFTGFFYFPRSYMINVLKINCGLLTIGGF